MALLGDIENITGGESACSLLQAPVLALRSAGDALDDMKNNPPAGIQQLAAAMQQLEVPTIPGVDALSDGIVALRAELPDDPAALTEPLAEAMADFFEGLRENFSGQLDEMLGGFSGLSALSEVGLSGPVDGSLSDKLSEMQAIFDFIPNPLNVETLLEFLGEGLQKFPRGRFPYRYLPLIDELRDKIETTLRWEDMTGAQIADELEATLEQLAVAIRQNFIDQGVGKVTARLTELHDGIDAASLENALAGMPGFLDDAANAVQAGDLSGATAAIAGLNQYKSDIQRILGQFDAETPIVNLTKQLLEALPGEMEDRALHFLAMIQPPHDMEALGLVFKPMNSLLESSGLENLLDKIGEFIGSIRSVLDGLNISSFKDAFVQVIGGAEAAVDGLRNMLMEMTVGFSALMDRVSDAIEGLGISGIIDTMEGGLRNFIALVQQTADNIFAPVRNFLLGIFNGINAFLDQLDPTVVVQSLQNIIGKFTDLLSNPQLLDAIDTVKGALDTVNTELGTFTFKPGTDLVVQGIDVVEKALQIASALPLPDSLKDELRDALNQLPRSLDPAVDIITDGLCEIVDEGPRPVLLNIKEGPGKLVDTVSQYSPKKLVEECMGSVYQDFLTEMERFEPSSLLVPIQQALDVVKAEVRRIGDPVEILSPLDEPYSELIGLLDAFEPEEMIGPLTDQLQDGIQVIIESLPIGAANAIFDQIDAVANRIQDVSDAMTDVRDFFEQFRQRLSGLSDAHTQIQALGDSIANRIDQVADISGVTTAMTSVSTALTDIHAAGLQTVLDTALNALASRLNGLNVKSRMAALAATLQTFPRTDLEALPPSLNKTNLLAFLDSFNPVSSDLAAPADLIHNLPGQLTALKSDFTLLLQDWDSRFLEPNGPIMQLHQPALTVSDLKTMLSDTIQAQLTDTLAPIMKMVEYLYAGLDRILGQISGLIQDLNEVLVDILAITTALEELRDALNSLVEALLNLDLGFLEEGFQEAFDTLRGELEALAPSNIAVVLAKAFDDLLEILDIDKLIGAGALDDEYGEIVTNLRKLDPKEIIIAVLQPEFEKLLVFLNRFDLSVQIDGFLAQVDRLKEDLRVELTRVADSYEDMWNAIPSSVGGVTGVTVSVTVTTA